MSVIGVVGSVQMGPWRLPQRAQTALIQSWVGQNGLAVDLIVSEFVFARSYPHLSPTAKQGTAPVWVIFASGYQLPVAMQERFALLQELRGVTLVFALEGESFQLPPEEGAPPQDLIAFLDELDHIGRLPIIDTETARTLAPLPSGATNVAI